MELKKYKLGELLDVTRGASLSGDHYATEGKYIRLTCGNFDYNNNCFKENTSKDNLYYTGPVKPEFIMRKGDIITPLTEQAVGLLGSTALIPESGKYIQSQDVAKISCKENLLYPNYAYYLISSSLVRYQLSAAAQQTKIRHTSPDKIKDCTVWIPNIDHQKRIGDFLARIDHKIALNRQINRNLEALTKQIYDYWFVQFDFPDENGKPYKSSGGKMVWNEKMKRELPKGWEMERIGDVADVINGATPSTSDERNYGGNVVWITPKDLSIQQQKFIYQGERNITQIGYESCSTHLLPVNTVLMSSRAPIGLLAIAKIKLCTNQGFKSFVAKDGNLSTYLYYYLQNHIKQIEQLGTGTTFKEVSREDILKFQILEPNESVLNTWEKVVSAINDQQLNIQKMNESLTKQRDELLPLLMNGQVNSDLLAYIVVYCWEHQIPNNMKEKIIDNVMAAMQGVLDCQQMKLLKVTLQEKLRNVSVSMPEQIGGNNNLALLETFISAKRIEGCSERSLRYYRSSIEQFFQIVQMPITQIDTSSIRTYLAQYQAERKCSKVTIDNMRRILSSFFAWLEDEDYIVKSPVRRIHKVKTDSLVRETLSDEQLEQLRDRCCNSRDLAIIDLLSSTGMRVGELVKLNRQDVNFEERQCVVFGKGNKERIVYFNARTKIHLQTYLSERTDNNKALFVSLNAPHRRLQISGVERRIKKLGQSVHIERVHPHKFRRTLATVAIDKGMPIEQVQRLLGHVRIDTTLHYAMVSQQNVKMSHKKYLS